MECSGYPELSPHVAILRYPNGVFIRFLFSIPYWIVLLVLTPPTYLCCRRWLKNDREWFCTKCVGLPVTDGWRTLLIAGTSRVQLAIVD